MNVSMQPTRYPRSIAQMYGGYSMCRTVPYVLAGAAANVDAAAENLAGASENLAGAAENLPGAAENVDAHTEAQYNEETQSLARDVADSVLRHLTTHTIGALDMKVVLEHEGIRNKKLRCAEGKSTKYMQAIPFRDAGSQSICWKIIIPMHKNMGSIGGGGRMMELLTPACNLDLVTPPYMPLRSIAEYMWKHMSAYNTWVNIVVNDNGPHNGHETFTDILHYTTYKEMWIHKLVDMLLWCSCLCVQHNVEHESVHHEHEHIKKREKISSAASRFPDK